RHAPVERIVGREDVTGPDLARRTVELDDPLHRLVEHADERWNACSRRGEVPVAVGDAGAHVEHLVDDCAHRRLPERGEHLVADRVTPVLDVLQGDRVVGGRCRCHGRSKMTKLPYGSTSVEQAGGTTIVEPFVSITAGPAKAAPGSSSSPV